MLTNSRRASRRAVRVTAAAVAVGLCVLSVPSLAGADPIATNADGRVPPLLGKPAGNDKVPVEVMAEVPPRPEGRSTVTFGAHVRAITAAGDRARAAADAAGDAATSSAVSSALAHIHEANLNWHGGQTDVPAVMALLRRAVEQIDDGRGEVMELGALMFDLGAFVARRFFDHAVARGADARSATRIEASWTAARDTAAAGDAGAGMGHLEDGVGFVSAKLVFDLPTFRENIGATFAFPQLAVGSAYGVYMNGALAGAGQQGLARVANDGAQWQQSTKEMNVASVSKTLSATLTLRKLDELSPLGIKAPIAPYFPSHWTLGPGVERTTFEDLLTQRSGLDQYLGGPSDSANYSGLDYAGLRKWIAFGVTKPKVFEYQNQNFAILRVLLPKMYGLSIQQPDAISCFFMGPEQCASYSDLLYAWSTENLYRSLMQQYVFIPSGIDGDCRPTEPANVRTLMYRVWPVNPLHQIGRDAGDWRAICGSGGWYLSALELARFASNLRNGSLLTAAERAVMNNRFLGYMDPDDYNGAWGEGAFGSYHNHGGDLGCCYAHEAFDSHEPGPFTSHPNRGLDSCLMSFPNNVQAAVLVNSQGVNYPGRPYQCGALQSAWENAWVWKF